MKKPIFLSKRANLFFKSQFCYLVAVEVLKLQFL